MPRGPQAHGLPPVRLVVTSPPYLGVLRYGQYNWLRMWLIGADAREVDGSLDEHRPTAYATFMADVLADLRATLAPDAVVVLVLGDVRVVRGHPIVGPPLAELVWERAAAPAGYTLVGAIADPVSPTRKVTKLWGGTAGGGDGRGHGPRSADWARPAGDAHSRALPRRYRGPTDRASSAGLAPISRSSRADRMTTGAPAGDPA